MSKPPEYAWMDERTIFGDCFDCDYYPVNLDETLCTKHANPFFDSLEEIFVAMERRVREAMQ